MKNIKKVGLKLMEIVYLDNAATTKMSEKVVEKMLDTYRNNYGNPSSIHRLGQRAKGSMERVREIISKGINCNHREIIFTSGGGEGNNLILKGYALKNRERGNHIITTKIEHPTVLECCEYLQKQGFEITYLEVDENGLISLEDLKKNIRENTILVSIMYANNETGVKQPIEKIGEILWERGILFHTDAVQCILHEKIDVNMMKIGALTATAHKFHGPNGAGFVYLSERYKIQREIHGGSQERNYRSGTENLCGIIGMGIAFEEAMENIGNKNKREYELLNYLENRLKNEIDRIKINGESVDRIESISNITIYGCDVQTLMVSLDMRGICVSGGSACMSGAQKDSHVLKAMGRNEEELKASFRVSIGKYNTKEEIDYFVENLKEIVKIERNV